MLNVKQHERLSGLVSVGFSFLSPSVETCVGINTGTVFNVC